MTVLPPSTTQAALKFGLYTGLASVLFYIVIIFTNQFQAPINSLVNVILIVGIVYGIKEYKNQSGGYCTFSQGFGIGMFISTITGVLTGILMMIYLNYDPSLIESLERARELQLEESNYTDEEIDLEMQLFRRMAGPNLFFFIFVILYFLTGLVLSLVIAFLNRNVPPSAEIKDE